LRNAFDIAQSLLRASRAVPNVMQMNFRTRWSRSTRLHLLAKAPAWGFDEASAFTLNNRHCTPFNRRILSNIGSIAFAFLHPDHPSETEPLRILAGRARTSEDVIAVDLEGRHRNRDCILGLSVLRLVSAPAVQCIDEVRGAGRSGGASLQSFSGKR